jgi:hypothetical protein
MRYVTELAVCFTCTAKGAPFPKGIDAQTIDGASVAVIPMVRPQRLEPARATTWRMDIAKLHDRMHGGNGDVALIRGIDKSTYAQDEDALTLDEMVRRARKQS